jgi:hypothetical protein
MRKQKEPRRLGEANARIGAKSNPSRPERRLCSCLGFGKENAFAVIKALEKETDVEVRG